jgi:serine/threonine protein phosphatase PrpC
MNAAHHMADALLPFYKEPQRHLGSREGLRDLLLGANQEIFDWGFIPDTHRPLGGCAGTIAWLAGDQLWLFHAGDTVAWVRSSGGWMRRTTHHGEGNALHRYFGLGPSLVIEERRTSFDEEDRVLIVSDGVTKVLGDTAITDVIDGGRVPERAVDRLAREAQAVGSPDDITVLLFERGSEE